MISPLHEDLERLASRASLNFNPSEAIPEFFHGAAKVSRRHNEAWVAPIHLGT